jgi:acetylglutamate kinase
MENKMQDKTIVNLKSSEKEQLYVIKIGGNIIDDEPKLISFLENFASIKGKKILVHGGGKLVTDLAGKLKIEQQVLNGRRITDKETLTLVVMVYAGLINKKIVASLQSHGCNALGLCGADGNSMIAHKRQINSTSGEPGVNYGFVGDVDIVNRELIELLLEKNISPVFAPVTHDKAGQLLNTNADTIATEIAKSLSNDYNVTLVYSFEKEGVLSDATNEDSVIKKINSSNYVELKSNGAIYAGMVPKMDNAFNAINKGVEKVIIGKAEKIHQLIKGESGTLIVR